MFLRVLAPRRRPYPVPVAGTFLSLAAHTAVVAALVASDGPALVRAGAHPITGGGGMATTHDGERLYWVGVGSAVGASPRRSGTRPPTAYVVPGRGAPPHEQPDGDGARGRTPGLARPHRPARSAAGPPAALPPAPASRRPSPRSLPRRLARLALPNVTLPEWEATLLVAGVLSAAPDLTQRVSRPEDFLPLPQPETTPGLGARSRTHSLTVLGVNVRMDDLPIPLVSNPPPAYPLTLERARVGGRVVVEFIIDSTGVVDLGSLRVVQSTNTLFTQAVRRVLPQLRFMPAQIAERAVGVTVRQPFEFTVRPGW
jgi:TonB family protein